MAPDDQITVDLFKTHWASALPDTTKNLCAGASSLFFNDPRPSYAAAAFGGGAGDLTGFRVLELGPLEGGHSYQLEGFGADVLGVEGNAEAYLKCLIVKELYGLRARFLFGNFLKYLESNSDTYDMIYASGVLYHMTEPLALIRSICMHSPRCFVWTHYFEPRSSKGFRRAAKVEQGFQAEHYVRKYGLRAYRKFWGGLADHACWLEREAIFGAFAEFGHRHIKLLEHTPDHPGGPAVSFATSTTPI
jgi:hypothetical protein